MKSLFSFCLLLLCSFSLSFSQKSIEYSEEGFPKLQYTFGAGKKQLGLKDRIPVTLTQPQYGAVYHHIVTYIFIINPEGDVIKVKPRASRNSAVVQAGLAAIKQWKFAPLTGDIPEKHKVRVDITFPSNLQ